MPSKIIGFRVRSSEAVWFCLVTVTYILLLQSPLVGEVGIFLRYDMLLLPLVLMAYFYMLSRLRSRLVGVFLSSFSVCFCGAILAGVWYSGVSDLSVTCGLFPRSDAFSYLNSSWRLLTVGELSPVASRRPLAPSNWSTLLYLGQGSVRGALAVQAFLIALAAAFATNRFIKVYGFLSGYVFFLCNMLFLRRFIGTFLTEPLGFILGCCAFGLLLEASRARDKVRLTSGTFFLSLALCARAGAFFVLPALGCWSGVCWRKGKRISFYAIMIVVLAVASGFLLNHSLLKHVGSSEKPFGNFSYVLYGMLHGGDWSSVLEHHPDLDELPEQERNREIFALAVDRLKSKPTSLLTGSARAIGSMFLSSDGAYSYIRYGVQGTFRNVSPNRNLIRVVWKYIHLLGTYGTFVIMTIFSLVGLFWFAVHRGRLSVYFLFCSAGILASAPFAPPWDSDLMRVYAATIPFMCVWPAVGASYLFFRLIHKCAFVPDENVNPAGVVGSRVGIVFCSCVTALFLLSPVLFARFTPSGAVSGNGYGSDRDTGLFVLPGSKICLEDESACNGIFVSKDKIQTNMGILKATVPGGAAELEDVLDRAKAISLAYDVVNKSLYYMVTDRLVDECTGGIMAQKAGFVRATSNEWWKVVD